MPLKCGAVSDQPNTNANNANDKNTPRPPSEREGYVPGARPAPRPAQAQARPTPAQKPSPQPAAPPPNRPKLPWKFKTSRQKLASTFFILAIIFVVLFFAAAAIGTVAYVSIAQELPDTAKLEANESQFASTRIFDRNGELIVELVDPTTPNAGRRTYVKLSEMSEWVKTATIGTEDPNFYRYRVGFDPIALVRAVYYLFTEGEVVSGGSTITQQVARNLLLDPTDRSFTRKLKEIILSNELVSRYSHDKILEIYLNEINYGNLAYGIEAAAQTYFNKPAKELTLAEASMLVGLPQAPYYWDPVQHPDRALKRQDTVLSLMTEKGFITQTQADGARAEAKKFAFTPKPVNVSSVAPHFLNYVREQLNTEFGTQGLYRDGLRVYTTLDRKIQAAAEKAVKDQMAALKGKNVNNAAVVVLDTHTGEILAMVGSADYASDAIKGQFNVALALRQPGSSVKPFTYLAELEKGGTVSNVYWDVPKTFVNQYGQSYTPTNYDGKFHGAVLMRNALANSYNVPAVLALDDVTVPTFLATAAKLGVNFPANPQYGLAITLGGAEAKLIEMTGAYGVFASGGYRAAPTSISKVTRANGEIVREYVKNGQVATPAAQPARAPALEGAQSAPAAPAPSGQVIAPEHAYLITSMLSDNAARTPAFGPNSALRTAYPSAVKTGTTNDYRDNLTIGYTPDVVVGVWAGNTDNSAMKDVSGVTGAAPIWRQVMDFVQQGKPAKPFPRPAGIVEQEICIDGGHAPSGNCPADRRKVEVFKADQPAAPPDERLEAAARAGDPRLLENSGPISSPEITISQPAGAVGRGMMQIRGTVNPPRFERYVVEYGSGDNPGEWKWISGPHLSGVVDGQLTEWTPPGDLPPGRYTIRVTARANGTDVFGYARFDLN